MIKLKKCSGDEAAFSSDSSCYMVCSSAVRVKSIHISSPILAAKSPYFYNMATSSNNSITYKKNTKINKKYISEKVFAHETMIEFEEIRKGTVEVEEVFAFQGWLNLLKDIMNTFRRPSYSRLESSVNGNKLVIDTNLIYEVLQIPNEGKSIFFDKVIISTLLRFYDEQTMRTTLLEDEAAYSNKLSTTNLKALPDILLTIVRSNIVQQLGHTSEVNNTQIVLLCSLINQEKINLPQLMIDQIWKSLNQTKHGLAYPHFLTKILKYLKLTKQIDEFSNYSPLNFINAKTFTGKRRFVEVDDGFQLSNAVLGSSSSRISDSTTLQNDSANTSHGGSSSTEINTLVNENRKLSRKVTKLMSFIGKLLGMPTIPSDSEDEE